MNFPEKVQEKLDCVDFLNDFEKFVELSEDFVVIFLENDFLFCHVLVVIINDLKDKICLISLQV